MEIHSVGNIDIAKSIGHKLAQDQIGWWKGKILKKTKTTMNTWPKRQNASLGDAATRGAGHKFA